MADIRRCAEAVWDEDVRSRNGPITSRDEATFQQIAQEAEGRCPVSNTPHGGVDIEMDATLV